MAAALIVLVSLAGCPREEPQSSATDPKALLQRLSSADRMAFVTHYRQGLELGRLFQAERALAEFDRCLKLCEDHPDALFQKARMLVRTGPIRDSIALLERLAKDDPGRLVVRCLLRDLYGSRGPTADAEKAAVEREAVRGICGRLGQFDLTVRQWLIATSEPNPCSALARMAAEPALRDTDTPLARLAHAYSRRAVMGPEARAVPQDLNRDSEALRAGRELLDRYPGLPGLCIEEGQWLLQTCVRFDLSDRGEEPPMSSSITLDLAQQYFERALDACALDSPLAHLALRNLGNVAREMGDFDRAVQLHTLLLDQPRVSPTVQFEARFNLGLANYRAGDLEKAGFWLKQCASTQRHPWVGWLLALCGEAEIPLRPEPVQAEHRRTLRFVDVAAELGVDKYDGAGPSAWCDVDLDGDLDLFVSGCDTFCILYRNDGDRFTDVSLQAGLENVASGFSSTFADYDNDGDCDLYIGRNGWSGPARNSLYRNRGDGTFEDVTEQAGVGDPGSSFVHGWADFDRDGHLDLFVANGITNDGSTNRLYHNNGDGTFTDATDRCGLSEAPEIRTIGFAIGDYDRDGWPDIFVNSWRTFNRLYHNRGDGTFEEVATSAGVDGRDHPNRGYVAFLADFDNDTWPDILLTKLAPFQMVLNGMLTGFEPTSRTSPTTTKYYRNRGDGSFVDMSDAAGLVYPHGTMGANVADVNNDGYLDFYLGTGDPQMSRLEPNAFYLNTGQGGFVDLTRFTGMGHLGKGHGITFADYDFDGDLDIYAPQGGFVHGDLWHNALYRNELGNVNNWLAVQLVGTRSNRMGVGAQLTLRAGDSVVYREMTAGGAFGSSSTPDVHFGLGSHTQIDSLEIRWPSGERTVYADPPVNRFIKIVESAEEIAVLERPRQPGGS